MRDCVTSSTAPEGGGSLAGDGVRLNDRSRLCNCQTFLGLVSGYFSFALHSSELRFCDAPGNCFNPSSGLLYL